jgi:hypothetical protein
MTVAFVPATVVLAVTTVLLASSAYKLWVETPKVSRGICVL